MDRLRQAQTEAVSEALTWIPKRFHHALGHDLFCEDPIFAGIFTPPWDNEQTPDGRSYRQIAHVAWPYHARDKRTMLVWPRAIKDPWQSVFIAIHELGHVLHGHLAERASEQAMSTYGGAGSTLEDGGLTLAVTPFPSERENGRICPVCGVFKSWDQFPLDASKASGRASRCMACDNERNRRYYAANSEARRAAARSRARRGGKVPRRCKRCGRPALSQRHHYCAACQEWAIERRAKSAQSRTALRDRQRTGSTSERGYGREHQALRKEWAERIERSGAVRCARCGMPIFVGEPWDLGHDDRDRGRYSGPEHRRCNRATAGRQPRANPRGWL